MFVLEGVFGIYVNVSFKKMNHILKPQTVLLNTMKCRKVVSYTSCKECRRKFIWCVLLVAGGAVEAGAGVLAGTVNCWAIVCVPWYS